MNLNRIRKVKIPFLRDIFVLVLFILTSAVSRAQDGAYLIPRIIHIGDPAVLIVPLPPSSGDSEDIVLTGEFPKDANIDFHRIILERRRSGGRLLIEFSAYTPGVLYLPVFEIGGETFSNLSVTVNSLFNGTDAPVLSGPASSLAMPGTAFLIYGSLAVLVFFILFTIWFLFKGLFFLRGLYKKYKRIMLFSNMKKTEKRLHKALLKGADKRLVLDEISLKFREFLGVFSGNNCLSMTANEFEDLPIAQTKVFPDKSAKGDDSPVDFKYLSLKDFFHTCDECRFCGTDVSSQDILRLLGDLRHFLDAFKNAGKAEAA